MSGDPAAEQDERDAEKRRGSHREMRHLGCEGVADDVEPVPELGGESRRDVDDAGCGYRETEEPQPTADRRRSARRPRLRRGPSPSHELSPVLVARPPPLAAACYDERSLAVRR